MSPPFIEALSGTRPLLADGATGTLLQDLGLPAGQAPERWTLERPEAIREVARGYIHAGCDVIYTNTFGANRVRLRLAGLESRVGELNRNAVRLAREEIGAASRQIFLLGSIGPTGDLLEPYGGLPPDAAREAFAEQAGALSEAGVDAIICETFTDLSEALLCLEAVRANTSLPVLASMAFDPNGRTMMGNTPEEAAVKLSEAGAAAVGANCSVGPDAMIAVIRAMKSAQPRVRLLAKPNAGMPQVTGNRTTYPAGPEKLALFAGQMRDLGAALVGGCCGTTPAHLRAMAAAIKGPVRQPPSP